MIVCATGKPNQSVIDAYGASYSQQVNDHSVGGRLYDADLLAQAGRASQDPNFAPAGWTWWAYEKAGRGKVVNGQWVWDGSMYPRMTALLR